MSRQGFKVAAFSTDVGETGEKNAVIAEQLIDQAARDWGVKMVCFPELFLTGVPDRATSKDDLK